MPDDAKPDEKTSFGSIAVDGDTSLEDLVVAATESQTREGASDAPASVESDSPNTSADVSDGSGNSVDHDLPRTSFRKQRLERRNRNAIIACLLTAIFVMALLWSVGYLRPSGLSELREIEPSVRFEYMCNDIAVSIRRGDAPDKFHVTEFEVTDEMIGHLIKLNSIETLIIDRGVLTDRSISTIAALPKLRHLRLRQSPITDEGLKSLAQCETLWYINLPHADCTAEGVAALAQLPRLRQLRLGSPKLGNEVTRAIATIESLRGIHLIGVAVTDEGLKSIATLPHLESLYLDDSKVTEAGWEWIFRNYPQIHVHVNQSHHDRDPKGHVHHN